MHIMLLYRNVCRRVDEEPCRDLNVVHYRGSSSSFLPLPPPLGAPRALPPRPPRLAPAPPRVDCWFVDDEGGGGDCLGTGGVGGEDANSEMGGFAEDDPKKEVLGAEKVDEPLVGLPRVVCLIGGSSRYISKEATSSDCWAAAGEEVPDTSNALGAAGLLCVDEDCCVGVRAGAVAGAGEEVIRARAGLGTAVFPGCLGEVTCWAAVEGVDGVADEEEEGGNRLRSGLRGWNLVLSTAEEDPGAEVDVDVDVDVEGEGEGEGEGMLPDGTGDDVDVVVDVGDAEGDGTAGEAVATVAQATVFDDVEIGVTGAGLGLVGEVAAAAACFCLCCCALCASSSLNFRSLISLSTFLAIASLCSDARRVAHTSTAVWLTVVRSSSGCWIFCTSSLCTCVRICLNSTATRGRTRRSTQLSSVTRPARWFT